MEVDIFRSWQLLGTEFHKVQEAHWRKLPYWIFIPFGMALISSHALVWYHPAGSPLWAIYGVPSAQILSLLLTALFWGQWQAKLSQDPRGSRSPFLFKILRTHWARTLLINAYALLLLAWVLRVVGPG